jgi:hypothetical protein
MRGKTFVYKLRKNTICAHALGGRQISQRTNSETSKGSNNDQVR